MAEPGKKSSFLLPEITDLPSAQQVGRQGTAVCVLMIVFNVVIWQVSAAAAGTPMPPIAIAELVIYAVIAVMIFKMSRAAAIAGFSFYLLGRIVLIAQSGLSGIPAIAMLLFSFAFINSMRGTFAYHRIRQERRAEIEQSEVSVK